MFHTASSLSLQNQTHDLSQSLSDLHLSDSVSDSSDNATLYSLSREDLSQIGAGSIREDVRVSRKKLEALILEEQEEDTVEGNGKGFIETLMQNTNTFIQWPSRMKIGAKTKKDLFVRIYGHDEDEVGDAKQQILQQLGPHRDLRITLKLEISYTDHSHLIGCRGVTIRKVMDDTGCHIHFPDSNRMSKDHKSNQVTIAGGSIQAVEQARSRVRELSPLIFQFNLPIIHSHFDMQMNPEANNIFIDNIQTTYNVQVTVHPPNKLQQTTVSVKGCEVDSIQIKEAVGRIINYFASETPVSFLKITAITIETTMEVTAVQHSFVRAVNDSNIHSIMMDTGAKIIFPDLSDNNIQQIKRSRIYITGDLHSVYLARQQLLGCLPLRMIFDLSDSFQLDWESVRQICTDLNVNVKMINRNRIGGSGPLGSSLPPPVPGRSRTIQLVGAERNAGNIFEARRRILGGMEPPMIANIPPTYVLRHIAPPGLLPPPFGNHLGPGGLPPLLHPNSPNMLSPVLSPSFWPPTPFSSPFCSPSILLPGHHESAMGGGNVTPIGNGHRQRIFQGMMQHKYGIDYGRLESTPSSSDLSSLFIKHGLERYIDSFLSEEIDLEAFSALSESDLRTLGVTSYPSRKKMLLLIAQLGVQGQ